MAERILDRNDLERRLCHALDIAGRTVERLGSNGYESPDPDERIRPEKIVAETALLLLAASTAGSAAARLRIDEVARLLIPLARNERMILGVCLEPSLAIDYASAHICLERLGYADPAFGAFLKKACDAQSSRGRERPPHRALEQEWLRGRRHRVIASAARESVLNHPMDLLKANRDDVYAFTHALMYVTDFNIDPRPLPRSRTAILAEAEAALAFCLDEQDYDLGGEVLLSWPLTGKSWSAAATFAFHVLARVEDRAGFLPAPNTRLKRLNELEGDQRTDYLLATAYHTIYVMGLLCAAALQPGRIPPAEIPRRTRVAAGTADTILDTLDADESDRHWREELHRLTSEERDALSGLLFSIALRRAITKHDYESVARLLRDGDALGLTGSPMASQSAEMLERLAMLPEWRRGWDSNPRYGYPHGGFQDRCLKPLGHPSVRMVEQTTTAEDSRRA